METTIETTGTTGRKEAARKRQKPKKPDVSLRRLISLARPYWLFLVGSGIGMLVSSLAGLALPAVAGNLIDTVFVKADREALNRVTLILVGVFVVQAIAIFFQNYLLTYAGERVVTDLRLRLYAHLQKLSLGYFNEQRTGDLMSRMTNDVSMVQNAVTSNIVSALGSIVMLIGGLVVLVVRDWRLMLLVIALIPVLMSVAFTIGRRLKRMANQISNELGEATTVLSETLGNQKTVKAFTREAYEINRYNFRVETVFSLATRRARLQSGFAAVMTFLSFGTAAAVLWYGGQEVLNGHLSPGELVSVLIYMGVVAAPIGALTGLYSEFQKALGAAERIFNLLDEPLTVQDKPGAQPISRAQGRLQFENVSFDYDQKTSVLRQVSFEARPGQVVALVGPSGAGKTTIANLIPRFYDPTDGRVLLDGQDIKEVQSQSLREQISVVLQEPVLFGTTVRENILYGRLEASEQELLQAARSANALEFIERLPEGFDTVVGERGVKLSGGQRQRIAIARALLRDPRLLILDEATSSLDNESESLVQEALDRLMRDRTTIVIAHRLTTIENADQIVVLDAGRVVETGTHAELLARSGLYHRLYTRQFGD